MSRRLYGMRYGVHWEILLANGDILVINISNCVDLGYRRYVVEEMRSRVMEVQW